MIFKFIVEEVKNVVMVKLVGDFNEWDFFVELMKKFKNGDFI